MEPSDRHVPRGTIRDGRVVPSSGPAAGFRRNYLPRCMPANRRVVILSRSAEAREPKSVAGARYELVFAAPAGSLLACAEGCCSSMVAQAAAVALVLVAHHGSRCVDREARQ